MVGVGGGVKEEQKQGKLSESRGRWREGRKICQLCLLQYRSKKASSGLIQDFSSKVGSKSWDEGSSHSLSWENPTKEPALLKCTSPLGDSSWH